MQVKYYNLAVGKLIIFEGCNLIFNLHAENQWKCLCCFCFQLPARPRQYLSQFTFKFKIWCHISFFRSHSDTGVSSMHINNVTADIKDIWRIKNIFFLRPNSDAHVTNCYLNSPTWPLCVMSRWWLCRLAEKRAGPCPASPPFLARPAALSLCREFWTDGPFYPGCEVTNVLACVTLKGIFIHALLLFAFLTDVRSVLIGLQSSFSCVCTLVNQVWFVLCMQV